MVRLDCVSRAHEIEIRPLPFVRPSSVHLWHRLSRNLLHEFLSNFSCCFPWAIYMPEPFLNFRRKNVFGIFYKYFSISLTCLWDPMGATNSKRYSSYKSQLKLFKNFLIFLLNGHHKLRLGIEMLTKIFRFR